MIGILNNITHVGLGAWVGLASNEPEYRTGALILAGGFLAYQTLESWKKGDGGWIETKEFLVGLAGGLLYKRWKALSEEQRKYYVDEVKEFVERVRGI